MNKKTVQDSVLYPIYEQVCNEHDLDKAKALITNHLSANLKHPDARRMKMEVQTRIQSYDKLLYWLFNNLQAYSGNKVIQPIPQ